MARPARLNGRWSLDFVSDQHANGRRFRVRNLIADYSGACIGQLVGTSIFGERLTHCLDELSLTRLLPKRMVLDNGPELSRKAMFFRAEERNATLV